MTGILLIKHSCVLLGLSAQVSATACSLFHRFYYKKSFTKYEFKVFAEASLFIASKIEECPRKYKDVISVF